MAKPVDFFCPAVRAEATVASRHLMPPDGTREQNWSLFSHDLCLSTRQTPPGRHAKVLENVRFICNTVSLLSGRIELNVAYVNA